MANTPAWAGLPVIGMVRISTANTNRDGTGTLGTLVTGDASGTVIARVRAVFSGSSGTTAGMLRYFLNDGTNKRLIMERRVTLINVSATVKGYEDEFELSDFGLKDATWSLLVGTHNAEQFDVTAYGGKL